MLVDALRSIPAENAILDGEVAILDDDGKLITFGVEDADADPNHDEIVRFKYLSAKDAASDLKHWRVLIWLD